MYNNKNHRNRGNYFHVIRYVAFWIVELLFVVSFSYNTDHVFGFISFQSFLRTHKKFRMDYSHQWKKKPHCSAVMRLEIHSSNVRPRFKWFLKWDNTVFSQPTIKGRWTIDLFGAQAATKLEWSSFFVRCARLFRAVLRFFQFFFRACLLLLFVLSSEPRIFFHPRPRTESRITTKRSSLVAIFVKRPSGNVARRFGTYKNDGRVVVSSLSNSS